MKAKGTVFDAFFEPPVKDKKSKKDKLKEVIEYHPVKLRLKGTKVGKQEIYSLYFTDHEGKHVLKVSITDVGEITLVDATSATPEESFERLPKKGKTKAFFGFKKEKKAQE